MLSKPPVLSTCVPGITHMNELLPSVPHNGTPPFKRLGKLGIQSEKFHSLFFRAHCFVPCLLDQRNFPLRFVHARNNSNNNAITKSHQHYSWLVPFVGVYLSPMPASHSNSRSTMSFPDNPTSLFIFRRFSPSSAATTREGCTHKSCSLDRQASVCLFSVVFQPQLGNLVKCELAMQRYALQDASDRSVHTYVTRRRYFRRMPNTGSLHLHPRHAAGAREGYLFGVIQDQPRAKYQLKEEFFIFHGCSCFIGATIQ